ICMSTERLIVDQKVAGACVMILTAKIAPVRAGDPQDSKSVLGSLVDVGAGRRINGLIDDAVNLGSSLMDCGQLQGSFLEPT
ncbi:aldehyde dehydrogenase family protein, partial [Pseudomonas syringae group genomosp. 7]|uniref:aldehyde dehydrogenase family protein n=1 Tax=Pseudomonas syringae group genomosp. 7 TaxID=251699 RepID=UPI00376F6C70